MGDKVKILIAAAMDDNKESVPDADGNKYQTVLCEYDGQRKQVPGFHGHITCPPASHFW